MQIATACGRVIEVVVERPTTICNHRGGVTLDAFSDFESYKCKDCGRPPTVGEIEAMFEPPIGQE